MHSRLIAQCETVVVCGREEAGFASLPDYPTADLGPLGGLCAALRHAADRDFTHVLSAGCDAPNLPSGLAEMLDGAGPAIVQSQPVIGLWPADLAEPLESFLSAGGRALYGFAEHVDARMVRFDPPLLNVNTPDDLPE